MATEVLTMDDKSKRDQMFQELRNSSQANERQVVRFSGVELVTAAAYDKAGKLVKKPVWKSTWSVAYPTN